MADPVGPKLVCLAPWACPGTSVAQDRKAPVPGLRLPSPGKASWTSSCRPSSRRSRSTSCSASATRSSLGGALAA
eukprot:7280742-Alexandrium_andersonii.AAC.1